MKRQNFPARNGVGTGGGLLLPEMLVEIEADAYITDPSEGA